ncbi:hypothetical protein HY091_03290 [Candidatus Kaiserbacteria bacterium]|nr:hypothetical protein [Candidatus Kaiserbacteria bacterium]
MKSLLIGVVLILVVGLGGFAYRNAVEHPSRPIACPVDAKVCPDGTAVARVGTTCDFPACPAPNVSLADAAIAFALPAGFAATASPDAATVAAYAATVASLTAPSEIIIRRYLLDASSTALAVIQETALGMASGAPLPATAFTSTTLGTHRFTVAAIGRFEGVVDTAYYLSRGQDVLRFDAVDQGVANWTDPGLKVSGLPANAALRVLLATLQGD